MPGANPGCGVALIPRLCRFTWTGGFASICSYHLSRVLLDDGHLVPLRSRCPSPGRTAYPQGRALFTPCVHGNHLITWVEHSALRTPGFVRETADCCTAPGRFEGGWPVLKLRLDVQYALRMDASMHLLCHTSGTLTPTARSCLDTRAMSRISLRIHPRQTALRPDAKPRSRRRVRYFDHLHLHALMKESNVANTLP